MDITTLLASDSYIIVNRDLMKAIGVAEAMLLGELASEYRYWKKAKKLEDGWFYSTGENLEDRLPFSRPTIKKATDRLEELGIIQTKLKGMSAKKYYKIDSLQLEKFLQQVCKDFYKQVCEDFSTKNKEEETIVKEITPPTPPGGSMNATSMRQELQRIFRVKNDPTKKQSLEGIKALQAELDDESILAAARSHKDVGVFTRKDGSTWMPDYFWFTNPRNTKAVVNWVVRRLADRNTEEEIDERTQAIVAWLIEHEYVESYDDYKKRQHALIHTLRQDEDFQNFIWEYDNRG